MIAQKSQPLTIKPLVSTGLFYYLPLLLCATTALPSYALAQTISPAIVTVEVGSNGRNAGIVTSSTKGGDSKSISFTQSIGQSLHTQTRHPSLALQTIGGRGGEGRNGVVSDDAGAAGGNAGAISTTIAGSIINSRAADTSGLVQLIASGGQAGSRMQGGKGGGNGGQITLNLNRATLNSSATDAPAIEAYSFGGNGNSGYQRAGARWSGSNGGDGNSVTLNSSGSLTSSSHGIFMVSQGGNGGHLDGGVAPGRDSGGGTGGKGGAINANIGINAQQTIQAQGIGVLLRSSGGEGGHITGSSIFNGATGGKGGKGGDIKATIEQLSLTILSKIGTHSSAGISAISEGGQGFWGGTSDFSRGGQGGAGGDGGNIELSLGKNVSIATYQPGAAGVQAISKGGSGGKGGNGGIFYAGGKGTPGGSGANVDLTSHASIFTYAEDAYGLYAASLGGSPGEGGQAHGLVAFGGNGGAGSRSGYAKLTHHGQVQTHGNASHGLFAQSIGGGGGTLGGKTTINALGGSTHSHSPDGHGDNVTVTNTGKVVVSGTAAKAILAQSIGAGGGNAGNVLGFISIGGNGGSSGNGGHVQVSNSGTLQSSGDYGHAIHAQSIGGGGGSGGETLSVGLGINYAHGGRGGASGDGGLVEVNLADSSTLTTKGREAYGILAQSIGGGGGDGGYSGAIGLLDIATISLGGDQGASGSAKGVSIKTRGQLTTEGESAHGVLAQSIGGGGGVAGEARGGVITLLALSFGGTTSTGGNGSVVDFINHSQLLTKGANAHGALLQSIGGGGGTGGDAAAMAIMYGGSLTLALGTKGGVGGDAGKVSAQNHSTIATQGEGSRALIAQSIGGGGGSGGKATSLAVAMGEQVAVAFSIAVGGEGASGGDADDVSLLNTGTLSTAGHNASAVLAQSVGGGGGLGGSAVSRSYTIAPKTFAGAVAVGGKGGDGGDGAKVNIDQQSSVTTKGNNSHAIIAQSIGGGGGEGGLTHGDATSESLSVSLAIGGSGGQGGNANTVTLNQSKAATTLTYGNGSHGILAQSVGGGGGTGSVIGDPSQMNWPDIPDDISTTSTSFAASLTIGGKGGDGGDGQQVNITHNGLVQTQGHVSHGLIAQSIGGGGGNAGSMSTQAPGASYSMNMTIGRTGGTGGVADKVQIEQRGSILTQGQGSTALLAQSIGGGGGNSGAIESMQASGGVSGNLSIGGKGGSGGKAGEVLVNQYGTLQAKQGHALVAQSVGGGGGNGTLVLAGVNSDGTRALIEKQKLPKQGYALALTVGGNGGSGGHGDAVTVNQFGTLLSAGRGMSAATLQSIGGGGGNGGVGSAFSKFGPVSKPTMRLSVGVGGNGGAAGDGGKVSWQLGEQAKIQTSDLYNDGVRLQSIGGGGGVGGGDLALGEEKTTQEGYSQYKLTTALVSVGGRNGDGGNGATISANHAQNSLIHTQGEGALGLLAQSIGGGGGLNNVLYDMGATQSTFQLGGGSGDGGALALDLNGQIHTQGARAHGVLAQSIGGGGGVIRAKGADGDINVAFNSRGYAIGNGGDITLNVDQLISTQGQSAFGLIAQSIGGGGGYLDSGNAWNTPSKLADSSQINLGNGGQVNLNIAGQVTTSGDYATAVLAQSIGGGGALTDGALTRINSSNELSQGTGGAIDVSVSGTVLTQGHAATAIQAQSLGRDGSGSISIRLEDQSRVEVQGTDSAALHLDNTLAFAHANQINIAQGATLIAAAEATAILSTGGSQWSATQIDNQGHLEGSIESDSLTSLNNQGVLVAGRTLNLSSSQLSNHGAMRIGNGYSRLNGSYYQGANGNYSPSIDFSQGNYDQLSVSGAVNLKGGKLVVQGQNHRPTDQWFNVLSSDSTFTLNEAFTSQSSAVYDYPFKLENNQLLVSLSADFNRATQGLSEDDQAVAHYLGRRWDALAQAPASNLLRSLTAAAASDYSSIFDGLAYAKDSAAYGQMLGQIANDAIQAPMAIMPLAHRMFLNRSLTCPSAGIGLEADDSACIWMDVERHRLSRSESTHESGFTYHADRQMLGGQMPLGNGWAIGGALSAEQANANAKHSDLTTEGDLFSAVGFIRKVDGPWSYTGALSAGYGSFTTERSIDTGLGAVRSYADWDFYFAALRSQVTYTYAGAGFYLRPALDLDVMYQNVPSYHEKGGEGYDLAFASNNQVRVMLSPSVELGKVVQGKGFALRPFIGLGANFMPDNDWQTDARLKGDHSGDGFSLSQDLPNRFAEVRAGIELETQQGFLLRSEIRHRQDSGYRDQAAEIRLGWNF